MGIKVYIYIPYMQFADCISVSHISDETDWELCAVHRGIPPQHFNMLQLGTVKHSSPELRWGYTRVSKGFLWNQSVMVTQLPQHS